VTEFFEQQFLHEHGAGKYDAEVEEEKAIGDEEALPPEGAPAAQLERDDAAEEGGDADADDVA
jgi:hypothetical protein